MAWRAAKTVKSIQACCEDQNEEKNSSLFGVILFEVQVFAGVVGRKGKEEKKKPQKPDRPCKL